MLTDRDVTESLRRVRFVEIQADAADRETLAARHGQVWDTRELGRDFSVLGYLAPYVVVERKADGVRGSLEFQHAPRCYFNWKEDPPHEESL